MHSGYQEATSRSHSQRYVIGFHQRSFLRSKAPEWLHPGGFRARRTHIDGTLQKDTGGWFLERPEIRAWLQPVKYYRLFWGHGVGVRLYSYTGSTYLNLVMQTLTDNYLGWLRPVKRCTSALPKKVNFVGIAEKSAYYSRPTTIIRVRRKELPTYTTITVSKIVKPLFRLLPAS